MSAIPELASFLAAFRAGSLANPTRRKLQLHVVDIVGAWIAASRIPEGQALIAFRDRLRDGGDGGAASLPLDVATNCALARLSEIDDIHLTAMVTPGSIVIPGALTLARSLPQSDPSDLVAAIVAGYDAMVRLGVAIDGPANLYRGIWPTYVAAPFGMAAVAARLLRLDARETAHALALALTLAAPGVGHHNAPTTARWLAVGNAARSGLTAAQAAQAGFTADVNLLESNFFANVYGITPVLAGLTSGLGASPLLDGVAFKPWCAARQTMAATEAVRHIMNGGVAPEDMQEIRVAVLPPHLKMIDHGVVPGDRASHLTSVQYQMAVAALAPDTALDVAQSPGELSPRLRSFMARITVEGDEMLLQSYPHKWPARIMVTTRSDTHTRSVYEVPGDRDRPLGWQQITQKFRTVVAPVLDREQADRMARRIVEDLEEGRSVLWLVDEVNEICARP